MAGSERVGIPVAGIEDDLAELAAAGISTDNINMNILGLFGGNLKTVDRKLNKVENSTEKPGFIRKLSMVFDNKGFEDGFSEVKMPEISLSERTPVSLVSTNLSSRTGVASKKQDAENQDASGNLARKLSMAFVESEGDKQVLVRKLSQAIDETLENTNENPEILKEAMKLKKRLDEAQKTVGLKRLPSVIQEGIEVQYRPLNEKFSHKLQKTSALRRMLSVVPGAVNSKNSSSKFELSKKNNVKNQDDLRGSLSRDCTELPYPFPSPEILSAAHVYHQTTQIQECPYPEEFSREEMAALSIRAVISTYEQAVVNNNRKSLRSSKQNSKSSKYNSRASSISSKFGLSGHASKTSFHHGKNGGKKGGFLSFLKDEFNREMNKEDDEKKKRVSIEEKRKERKVARAAAKYSGGGLHK